ncbi:class I SAM-dependent methyltransferase [Cellulomonas sp. P5_C6]
MPDTALPPLTWMGTLRWPLVERAMAQEPRTASVLELGCGQGALGARLARTFDSYTGVEPDQSSAQVAQARVEPWGGRVVPDLADAGSGAQIVCAFEVLEHIEDDRAALAGWLTHAAPGALCVFSVPADPHRFSTTDRLVGHYRRYTDDDLGGLLTSVGLVDVRLRRYGYPVAYALEDARNLAATRRLTGEGADQESMDERSHGSGRLFQPHRPWEGTLRQVATKPFRVWQDAVPGRGPCLVASGRVSPAS